MKIQKRICLALFSLLLAIMFPLSVFAALPQIDSIQWVNTMSVSCNIQVVSSTRAIFVAEITGKSGSTVQGTIELYETIGNTTTLLYSDSDPATSAPPKVAFSHEFNIQGGATYYLELNGIVSKNGYDEIISFSDTEYVPPIPPIN